MEAKVERLEAAVFQLEETLKKSNNAEEKLMCQYDTMSQMFLEEKKLLLGQMDSMRKHYQKIILSISLVLLIIVGSLVGGIIYLVSNYDFAYDTYQSVSAEGSGDATIEDGISMYEPFGSNGGDKNVK